MKMLLDQNKIPSAEDFRPVAIQKALTRYSMGHWSFRYAWPLLIGSSAFGVLFGFSYNLFLAMIGITGFASINFVLNQYINAEKFKRKYIDELLLLQERRTRLKQQNLKNELEKYGLADGANQLKQFTIKYRTLVEILDSKFDKTQLTYSRYQGIASEVYLSGIDNLNDMLLAKKTMASIDLKYVSDRLSKLDEKDSNNKAVEKEKDALLRSQYSYKLQEEKIYKLMAENEAALTQIDETTIAISEITKSTNREAQVNMENSMKQLAEMAERTKLYSR